MHSKKVQRLIRLTFLFNQFQEESEVPDDETVNQMIARTEDEFEMYQVGIVLYLAGQLTGMF